MALTDPRELFLHELSSVYDAGRKVAQMLGEVDGQLRDEHLAEMFRRHEQETRRQIADLEQCFQVLDTRPRSVTCDAMEGIRKDYQSVIIRQPSPEVLEMFVLGNTLKIEHYEIAAYRGLIDRAVLMGETRCAQILQAILVRREEAAARLERAGHELGERILTPA